MPPLISYKNAKSYRKDTTLTESCNVINKNALPSNRIVAIKVNPSKKCTTLFY